MYLKIPKNTIARMEIIQTDCKLSLAQVVAKYKPKYAFNGGLYDMETGELCPIPLRINGKTVATSKDGYWMMAWNEGSDLCMIHSRDMAKWKYAITCAPFLKDGANTYFKPDGGMHWVRGRTAFGDDSEYAHVVVTTDTNGAMSPATLRSTMKSGGAQNAIMLDSGGSSQLYADGKYYQAEKRKVANWVLIWTKEEENDTNKQTTMVCPYKEPILLVKRNSRGEGAKWVQWHLSQLGLYTMKIDGIFGNGSVNALLAFQKLVFKDKKEWDGICGAKTRKLLIEEVNSR